MEFLTSLQPWHWIILSLALFGAEALGASGFLIGAAIASLGLGLLTLLVDGLGWELQATLFALSAVACSVIYWRFFREYNERTDHPQLNNRAAQLIGKTITLEQGLVNGEGRIQLGDTFWKVRSEQPLSAGETVVIVATDGMTLLLEAAQS